MPDSRPLGQYERSLTSARRVRDQFIDLTYKFPEPASQDVLRLWNVADRALLDFIRALEALDA